MGALSLGHLEDGARATEYRNDVLADYKTELEGRESWRLAIGDWGPRTRNEGHCSVVFLRGKAALGTALLPPTPIKAN